MSMKTSLTALALGVTLTLLACGAKEVVPSEDSAPSTDVTLASQLAAADAADGTVDKVVTKCAGCALGMEGKADHALDVTDYSMHFCSAGCKDGFSADAEGKVLALKIAER